MEEPEEEVVKIITKKSIRTGGMKELVDACKRCKGQPDTRVFEIEGFEGECCAKDDCMLVVRWEEVPIEE